MQTVGYNGAGKLYEISQVKSLIIQKYDLFDPISFKISREYEAAGNTNGSKIRSLANMVNQYNKITQPRLFNK